MSTFVAKRTVLQYVLPSDQHHVKNKIKQKPKSHQKKNKNNQLELYLDNYGVNMIEDSYPI